MKTGPTYTANIYASEFPAKGSRLVYGSSGLGGVWGPVDESESVECLLYAFENGISSLDTAPSYNNAEHVVGRALKRWQGEMPFISTKVGRLQAEGAYDFKLDFSRIGMTDSVHRSLDVLGVPQVDLLFLHEPQCIPADQVQEVVETMQGFKETGLTRMLGVGGNPVPLIVPFLVPQYFQVLSGFCKLDASNLTAFDHDIPLLEANKLFYYAASSLHFSLLGDGFDKFRLNPPGGQYITDTDISKAQRINHIAQKNDMRLSGLAQRYLFSISEASRIVMGASKMTQIVDSVADWNQGALSENLFNEITTVLKDY